MSRGRVAVLTVGALLVLGVAWVAWQVWHVNDSLNAAADDAQSLQAALGVGDQRSVDDVLHRLREHSADADDRTSGTTWSMLEHLPVYGDDVEGVQVVSSVLHDLTQEGFAELAQSAADLESYTPRDGQVPLDTLEALQEPVSKADAAFAKADQRLSSRDTSTYVGPLRRNYEVLADRVAEASSALATAHKSLRLLPPMLGEERPRNYLLVFQNNAEIRATGGLPGAWALITANNGTVEIVRQGTGNDFPPHDGEPILPLTSEELELYGPQLGDFFQDANFTPDFPRTAELWRAWWGTTFPDQPLDGVLALDPVALSYLLEGTGPLPVGDVVLTPENAVEELLSTPYLTADSAAQNSFFALAARSIFEAVTRGLQAPMDFLRGLQRGAREGRVYLTSFQADEEAEIRGTSLEGGVAADDGSSPRVFIAINDATGSKMSYYLRYRAQIQARGCGETGQSLLGTMSLNQSILASEAAELPAAVTGGGLHGTQAGRQLVAVRIYGPTGGTIDGVRIDGKRADPVSVQLNGRPVVLVLLELSGPDDVVVTWDMTSGPAQTGNGHVVVTPSVVPGSKSAAFRSAC
jgi:hypothetical protein